MNPHGGTDNPDTIRRNQVIGAVLRELREDARLSQADVERRSDEQFKATVIGSYERGERGLSIDRLYSLAEFYRVRPAHLIQVIEHRCSGDIAPLERREDEGRRTDRRPLPSSLARSVVGGDPNR